MTNPNYAAKSASATDAKTGIGTCPLKQSKIQLVPVRYALVEHNVDFPAIDSQLKNVAGFRPLGVRPLSVDGYLYVIHSNRQDIIYVYTVKTDGSVQKQEQQSLSSGGQEYVYSESENALIVERCGYIDIMYSRTPISPKLQNQLLESASLRKQLMQRCPVGQFMAGRGARHLLPPTKLNDVLADSHPDKSDYDQEFRWCWEQTSPDTDDAAVYTAHILTQYQKDSAILILEDPIGIMTELASSYIGITGMEQRWFEQDNNKAKYFAASQITLLMKVGGDQFKASTRNKLIAACIDTDLDALKQRYLAYTHASEEYWHFVSSHVPKLSYVTNMDEIYESRELKTYQQEQEKNAKFASEHQIASDDLTQFFKRIKQENRDLLQGEWNGLTGDRGILDRIRADEMQNWYDEAQKKITRWRAQTDQLDNDRVAMLAPAYDALPVFDKENKKTLLARLKLENHWLVSLAEQDHNRDKARDFFFASLGEQNLHTFISDQDNVATLVKHDASYHKLMAELVTLINIKVKASDMLNELNGQGDVTTLISKHHLVDIGEIPDNIRCQFSLIGSQLSSLVMGELHQLTTQIKSTQARADSLVSHIRPGLMAVLLGHKKNANVVLDVGTELGTESFDKSFSQLEHIRLDADNMIRERNAVQTRKGLTIAEKEGLRANYNRQLRELTQQAQDMWSDLSVRSEPIAQSGQPHLPSQITIKAAGAVADDLDTLLRLQRKALTNELWYGKAKGLGFKGSVGMGSLALVTFVANGWNWCVTLDHFEQKSKLTVIQAFEYVTGLTSLLSSTGSIVIEVVRAKGLYNWITQSAESGLILAGKVVTLGTLGVSVLISLSSFLDIFEQKDRIQKSWQKGDAGALVSAGAALSGDSIQAWHSGKIAFYGYNQAMKAVAEEITWQAAAESTLSFAAKANPWMLVATILIFAGEWGYNFFQSTPLMQWISRCAWGKNGHWFWHHYQGWDYPTQLTHWQEVIQAPILTIEATPYKKEHISPSGNWSTIITKHRVKTLRLLVPMVVPQQVRLAGYVKTATGNIDITRDNLIAYSRVTQDGLRTVYEFDWPQDPQRQRTLLYLDLLVEVTTVQGGILFAGQHGARFTLNLQQPQELESLPNQPGWYQVTQLDPSDDQSTPNSLLTAALKPLQKADNTTQRRP